MEQIESLDNFNIYSFCRTCLENLDSIEIYNDIFAIPDLQMKLTQCTFLTVELEDGFPTNLCEQCFTKIEEFYTFQQMCISSRKRFQVYLHSERKPCLTASPDLMVSIEVKKENEDKDSMYLNLLSGLKEEFSINVKEESNYLSNEEEEIQPNADCKINVREHFRNQCENDGNVVSIVACNPNNIPPDFMMLTESEKDNDPILSLDQFSEIVKEELPLNLDEEITYSSNEEQSEGSKINIHDNSTNDCASIKAGNDATVRSTSHKTTRRKKFECKICKKRFRIIEKLEVHIRQHQGLKPFPCHFCKKSYTRRDTLKYHVQDKHKGKLPPTDVEIAIDLSRIPKKSIMLTRTKRKNKEEDPTSVDQLSELNKEEFSKNYSLNENKSEESQQNAECKINVNEESSYSQRNESNDSTHNMAREATQNNALKLECEICKQCFKKSDKLERHLRLHNGLKPFPCHLCDKAYSRRNRLNLHIQEKHNGKPSCIEVEFVMDSSNAPEDLIGITEAQQKLGKEFSVNTKGSSNVDVLEEYQQFAEVKTNNVEAYFSNDCGEIKEITIDPMIATDPSNIPPQSIMLTELKEENNQFSEVIKEEYSVNVINHIKYLSNEDELKGIQAYDENKINLEENSNNNPDGIKKIEKKGHTIKKKIKCEICMKVFKKTENLELHMRVHQGLKPFSCQFCERSYSRKNTLRKHICINKRAHKKPKKHRNSYVCEQCGKVLATAATLKNHCFLHTQELPYECPRCQKKYITRSLLRRHMDRHSCSNLICPHCGVKRNTQKDLKRHINTHTKEKGYPCQLCDMVFYSNGKLNKHKRAVHEDIKDFPCLYCEKSFGTAEARKTHEIIHTGEKPFECGTCHRKFTRIITLRRHQKVHLIAENDA